MPKNERWTVLLKAVFQSDRKSGLTHAMKRAHLMYPAFKRAFPGAAPSDAKATHWVQTHKSRSRSRSRSR